MILRIEYVLGEVPNQVTAQTGSQKMISFTVTLAARREGEAMVIARGMALPNETYMNGKFVMGFFDRLERYKKEFEGEDVQIAHVEAQKGQGFIEFDTGNKVPEVAKEPSPN